MTVVIVDPGLHSMGGHHFNATVELQATLDALGMEHRCLGSAFADDRTVSELGCVPCFSTSVYGRTYEGESEFTEKVRLTGHELSRGLRTIAVEPELIVLPCCDQVLALAIARHFGRPWSGRRWFGPLPSTLLWLLLPPHHGKPFDDRGSERFKDEYRIAFAALRGALGSGIVGYCETRPMADAFSRLTGLDLGVAAGPGLVRRPDHWRPRGRSPDATGDVRIAAAGFANHAKGYHLLPRAIERVLARAPAVSFNVHGIVQGSDAPQRRSSFDAMAALGSRVRVRTDVLSAAAYVDWLEEADLLLLPYDPLIYQTRGSGLFVEARRLGIPVVATQGCGFAAEAFSQGWGTPIARYDGDSVAAAILASLDRLDDMKHLAGIAAAAEEPDCRALLKDALARATRPRSTFRRVATGLLGRLLGRTNAP